jgi:phage tail tape-measure protein
LAASGAHDRETLAVTLLDRPTQTKMWAGKGHVEMDQTKERVTQETPAERDLRREQELARQRKTSDVDHDEAGTEALGAGAGALMGAGVGAAVGGPVGAAVGGVAGAVGGAIAGEAIEGDDEAGAGAGAGGGAIAGAALGGAVAGPPGAVVGGAVGAGAGAGIGDKTEEDLEADTDGDPKSTPARDPRTYEPTR